MTNIKKQLAIRSQYRTAYDSENLHTSQPYLERDDAISERWKNDIEDELVDTRTKIRQLIQRLNIMDRQLKILMPNWDETHPTTTQPPFELHADITALITQVTHLQQQIQGQNANTADIRATLEDTQKQIKIMTPHFPAPSLIVNTDIILPNDRIVRTTDEKNLVACLKKSDTRIVEISMMGGSGKSCFTREFLQSYKGKHDLTYQQHIWFSFYTLKSRDIMAPFEALLDMIIMEARLWPNQTTIKSKWRCVQHYLNTTHTLMVLDGLEIAQQGDLTQDDGAKHVKPYDVGRFKDPEFAKFMIALTHNTQSHVLVSSRVPLRDLRDERNIACKGLVVFELPQWRDEEILKYLSSGNTTHEAETQMTPIIDVLGRHPLTLSLFKGMLYERYDGQWEKAKTIIQKLIRLMSSDSDNETMYEKQLKRIRGILGEVDNRLNHRHRQLLERLSGMYGELRESHYPMLILPCITEQKDGWDSMVDETLDYLEELRGYNLLVEGRSQGERNVTAHPMVKLSIMKRLDRQDQIKVHTLLMSYFQAQPIADRLEREEQFDDLMEWAHQVLTLMRIDGTLQECGNSPKINKLKHSVLYEQMRGVMGRYISERGMSYLQQEIFLAERKANIADPAPATDAVPTSPTTLASISPVKRPGLMANIKALFGSRHNAKQTNIHSSSKHHTSIKKEASYYHDALISLSEKIEKNIHNVNVFYENIAIIEQIIHLIRDAKEHGIQLSEPSAIAATVFYGMYVKTITKTGHGSPHLTISDEAMTHQVKEVMGENFIGVAEWRKLFGTNAIDESEVPALPETIAEILTAPCPIHPKTSQRVCETHVLFLMPTKLNGQALTMMEWDRLLKNQTMVINSSYQKTCKYYNTNWYQNDAFANRAETMPHWVLMSKEILRGSPNKRYDAQAAYLSAYQAKHPNANGYRILSAVDMATGIFLYYLQTGKRFYGDDYKVSLREKKYWVYGITKDTSESGKPVWIGHFDSSGLDVAIDDIPRSHQWVGGIAVYSGLLTTSKGNIEGGSDV